MTTSMIANTTPHKGNRVFHPVDFMPGAVEAKPKRHAQKPRSIFRAFKDIAVRLGANKK